MDSSVSSDEEFIQENLQGVLKPYCFEPQKSSQSHQDSSSETESSESDSLPSDLWCTCGNCSQVDGQLNKCCTSYNNIKDRLERTAFKCITQHPGFQSNCLDIYVLEASFYEFCQEQGPPGDDELMHDTLRYLAYRRFIRFIFKRLGKKVRKIIPCCAVLSIREAFPASNGHYTGFKYP